MKMTPEQADLTIRDMGSYLLRAFMSSTLRATREMDDSREMAVAVSPLAFVLKGIIDAMEDGFDKDNIPSPQEAKAVMNPVLKKIADDLDKLCGEIFQKS